MTYTTISIWVTAKTVNPFSIVTNALAECGLGNFLEYEECCQIFIQVKLKTMVIAYNLKNLNTDGSKRDRPSKKLLFSRKFGFTL